jgi:hypothetical protein
MTVSYTRKLGSMTQRNPDENGQIRGKNATGPAAAAPRKPKARPLDQKRAKIAVPLGLAGKHDIRLPWGGVLDTTPICIEPLIIGMDVEALAREAGYPIPTDPSASAKWLDLDMRVAASYAMMEWNKATPLDHRKWNELVHRRATELLNALGFVDADDVLGRERIEVLHGSGLALGGAAMHFDHEVHKARLRSTPILISAEVARLLQIEPTRICDEKAFIFLQQMFVALPWLIGALAKGTGAMKGMPITNSPRKIGNMPKYFQGQVFKFLQKDFQGITGQPLSGLRKADQDGVGTRNPNAKPVIWCKKMFAMMAERIPVKVVNAPAALLEEVAGLAALSESSIAEYLVRKSKTRSKRAPTTE